MRPCYIILVDIVGKAAFFSRKRGHAQNVQAAVSSSIVAEAHTTSTPIYTLDTLDTFTLA